MEKQTIIQQIQPNCNNLFKRVKDETKKQHKTHRDLVETTGIPKYTIAKFFSGRLSSPGVYDVAAICIDLGLSLDELMGIAPPPLPQEDNALEIAELKGRLAKAEAEVKLLKERCKIYENGIAERKPIIYGLVGLCIFLSLVFVVYLFVDVSDSEHGFIRNHNISPALVILILAIVCTTLGMAHSIAKRKAIIKRNGENESNGKNN